MTDLGECFVHLIPEHTSVPPLLPPTEEVTTHLVVRSRIVVVRQVFETALLLVMRIVDIDPSNYATIGASNYQES